jgi:hypothetical protein
MASLNKAAVFRKSSLPISLAYGGILMRAEAATQGNCFDAKSATCSVTVAPQKELTVFPRAT